MPKGQVKKRDLDENGWVKFDLQATEAPPLRDLSARSIYGGMFLAIRDKVPFTDNGDAEHGWFRIDGTWDEQEAEHAVGAIRDYFGKRAEFQDIKVSITRRGNRIFVRKSHVST